MKNIISSIALNVFLGCSMNITNVSAEPVCTAHVEKSSYPYNERYEDVFQKHLQILKHLDVANPRLLIMFSGTPGMGKTTVAKELEDELQAIRLSTDEARFFLQASGLNTTLADAYLDWCLQKVTEISSNHLIILDRSVDRTYPGYLKFAKSYGYDTFLVRMQVPRPIVEERIRKRGREDTAAILQGADRSWYDYELFNNQYVANYVFVNEVEAEPSLTELIDMLTLRLQSRVPFQELVPGTSEFTATRNAILNSAEMVPSVCADHMHEILPGLYLGNQLAANDVSAYKHVTHVLSLRTEPPELGVSHIVWKGIAITDSHESTISTHFDDTYDFIENADGAILVHCREGVSRSATIMIAYLMRKFNVPYQAALEFVQKKRAVVQPNKGFQKELKQYEEILLERTASTNRQIEFTRTISY